MSDYAKQVMALTEGLAAEIGKRAVPPRFQQEAIERINEIQNELLWLIGFEASAPEGEK